MQRNQPINSFGNDYQNRSIGGADRYKNKNGLQQPLVMTLGGLGKILCFRDATDSDMARARITDSQRRLGLERGISSKRISVKRISGDLG